MFCRTVTFLVITLYLLATSSVGLMLVTLFSFTVTTLWMWRHKMTRFSFHLVSVFMPDSPAVLHRWNFHLLWILIIASFLLIGCYFHIWEDLMMKLPLDLSSTGVDKTKAHLSLFSPEFLKWILRNSVTATLFTEGVLPYQCICCHRLHSLSGQKSLFLDKKKKIYSYFPPKYEPQMWTEI